MGLRLCVVLQVMVLCVDTIGAVSEGSHVTSPWGMDLNSSGISSLHELYKKCLSRDPSKSLEECLSIQVVILTDRMVHQKRIPLMEGVALVGKEQSSGRSLSEERILTEENLEASLPRSLDTRQGVLDKLMIQKLSHFFTTHSLQVEVHVGRKLKGMKINKLLLPFLMGVVMKISSIVPVILSIMGAMALNAMMAGKGALMIAGLMALRKILQHGNHNGQNKRTHIIQQDTGMSSVGHGLTNLVHSFGAMDHQYGGHDHGSVHNSPGHVLYGRSLRDAANGSVNTERHSSAKVDTRAHTSTTTEIPQYIQNFRYPSVTRTLVPS